MRYVENPNLARGRSLSVYDFSTARKYVEAQGLSWSDEVEAQVAPEFERLRLSQVQVDRLLVLHVHYLKWALSPKRLTPMQRVKAALFFLKG